MVRAFLRSENAPLVSGGQRASGKSAFTDVYIGVEGYPVVSCVAPYYDEKGFAGMAGISHNVVSLYRDIAKNTIGDTGINFILNQKGEIALSSEKEGVLAASETPKDFRKYGETDFALEAERMTQGMSNVALVTLGDKEYYLAYAPISDVGWSFGTLIERDVVVQPARTAKETLLSQTADFTDTLQAAFMDNLLRTAALLLALLGVREISGGNLDRKIDVKSGDEIATLADSFNQ